MTDAEATTAWKRFVHPTREHLLQIPQVERSGTEAVSLTLDTDQPAESRSVLRAALTSPEAETALCLWSPSVGLRCPWGSFLRYWDDFWYPSDDNSVVVLPASMIRIEFVDEQVSVVDLSHGAR